VSVVQENCPLELAPKIGVGIMGIHRNNKMKPMYHTGKNGVKAGRTLPQGVGHGCGDDLPETNL
jgi:hypothetical protein